MNSFAPVIDVMIITALREEYAQVLEVNAGAASGSSWQVRPGPLGHKVAFRSFAANREGNQPLEIAVTWASGMGGVATAGLAERIIAEYRPRCLKVLSQGAAVSRCQALLHGLIAGQDAAERKSSCMPPSVRAILAAPC